MRAGHTTRGGFTLVEMLVALAVAGIALAAGFGALATLQDRTALATAANVGALEGAVTRGMIVDWISGARLQDEELEARFLGIAAGSLPAVAPQGGRDSRALRQEAERLNAQTAASFVTGPAATDELYFPTTARTPLDVPITSVRLFVDRDPATPEQGLVAELLGRQEDVPTRLELVPEVTGMTIRYLPNIDGEVMLATEWRESDLPRAVYVYLEGAPGAPLPPLLALPIRVALATIR